MKELISTPILKRQHPLIRCIYPYNSISIDSDLSVNPCPCSGGPKIGQITDQITSKDIWYGEKIQKFRKDMYSENPPEPCRTCDKWNRGSIEWFNAYMRLVKAYR